MFDIGNHLISTGTTQILLQVQDRHRYNSIRTTDT
jgi:hypothetical protein